MLERVDVVALLDEWAARFFEELDCAPPGPFGTRSCPLACVCGQCMSLLVSNTPAGSIHAAGTPKLCAARLKSTETNSLQVGCETKLRYLTTEPSFTHSAAQSHEQPGEQAKHVHSAPCGY